MLPSLTPRRKDSGFVPSFLSSSPASSTPPHCFQIINPPLHSLKITSTTRIPSTSTSTFILFTTSLKMVLFTSSTALPTTWSPTHLRRLFRLLKSSILRCNLDFLHLEGECWNYKVTTSSDHRFPVSPFLLLWLNPLRYNSFPLLTCSQYFILPTTRDTHIARVLVPFNFSVEYISTILYVLLPQSFGYHAQTLR
jgi:hypothetical protein